MNRYKFTTDAETGCYYLASEVESELDVMNLAVGYFHEENDRFITRMAELEKALRLIQNNVMCPHFFREIASKALMVPGVGK